MERREDDKMDRVGSPGVAPRKPYSSPRLRVYGDVAALTRTLGHRSKKADGGSGNMSKTG